MCKWMAFAVFLFLAACGGDEMNDEKPTIVFSINGDIETAQAGSSVKFNKDCMLGICLYKYSLSFNENRRADIAINPNTSTTLSVHDAVGVTLGTYRSDTINDAHITLGGVTPNSPHSQAMSYFYAQVESLLAKGWRRYIMPNEARVPGYEARKFETIDEVNGKPVGTGPWRDPSLKLSQPEWLSLPMFNDWYFYKDGIYLTLSMQRENSTNAPADNGSYLFTFDIRSEIEFYKDFVSSEEREDWISLLPAKLKRMAQERAQTEARLKKMGIAIDENYQDPPIKALE